MYLWQITFHYRSKGSYSFGQCKLQIVCEDNVKLLGITIDSDLNFDNHISEFQTIKYFKKNW
jgi:hypothetical protein